MSDIKLSATAISIDPESVKQLVDQAVENSILSAVSTLGTDPEWLAKIERMINQAVVQRTLAGLGAIDVSEVIRNQVNENMARLKLELLENFSSTGIDDRATSCQLTIMDDITVVENKLTTHSAEVVEDFTVKNLIVKGGINTDNRSWNELTDKIKNRDIVELKKPFEIKNGKEIYDPGFTLSQLESILKNVHNLKVKKVYAKNNKATAIEEKSVIAIIQGFFDFKISAIAPKKGASNPTINPESPRAKLHVAIPSFSFVMTIFAK